MTKGVKKNVNGTDVKRIKEMLNNGVYEQTGIKMFDKEGRLDFESIKKIWNKTVETKSFPENISKIKVLESKTSQIELEYNGNDLTAYVPKQVKEKIQFYVEYIMSEFDKVNAAVAATSYNFVVNRKGVVNAAANTLERVDEWNEINYKDLIRARQDLAPAIEQLKGAVIHNISNICKIPKERRKRLLYRVDVETALSWEKEARISLVDYVHALGIYTEISLKLGNNKAAVFYINDGIDFLNTIQLEQLLRMEGWNENKDHFWDQKVKKYIPLLQDGLKEIINVDEKLTVEI